MVAGYGCCFMFSWLLIIVVADLLNGLILSKTEPEKKMFAKNEPEKNFFFLSKTEPEKKIIAF